MPSKVKRKIDKCNIYLCKNCKRISILDPYFTLICVNCDTILQFIEVDDPKLKEWFLMLYD